MTVRMSPKQRRIVVVAVVGAVVVAIAVYFALACQFERIRGRYLRTRRVAFALKLYMQDTGGCWPPSMESIRVKHLVADGPSPECYIIPARRRFEISGREVWSGIRQVRRQYVDAINFGCITDFQEVEWRDRELVRRETGVPVALFDLERIDPPEREVFARMPLELFHHAEIRGYTTAGGVLTGERRTKDPDAHPP